MIKETRTKIEGKTHENIIIDGQKLFCPDQEQWEHLFKHPIFHGKEISSIHLIEKKVRTNWAFEEIKNCLGNFKEWVLFYELVSMEGKWVRVFVESVICETCGQRPEISATPSVPEIYFGAEDPEAVKTKGFNYPNLKCKWCNSTYDRRHTIWQKYHS